MVMLTIKEAYKYQLIKEAVLERYIPPVIQDKDKKSKANSVARYALSGGAIGAGGGVLKMLATGNPLQIPMGFVAGATTGAGLDVAEQHRKKIGKLISGSSRNKYNDMIGGAALGSGVGLLTGAISAPFVGPIAIPLYTLTDATIGAIGSQNIVNFIKDVTRYIKKTGRGIEDYLSEKKHHR